MKKIELTIKRGKGPLGKDKRPFAPRTLHMQDGEWLSPLPYTAEALLSCLLSDAVSGIEMICESNTQYTIKIKR
jgi:hypothetical protein